MQRKLPVKNSSSIQLACCLAACLFACANETEERSSPPGIQWDVSVPNEATDLGVNQVDAGNPVTEPVTIDAGDVCSDAPDAPTDLECNRWLCEAVPAPNCWMCRSEPANDGADCTAEDGGVHSCSNGLCIPNIDLAEQGPSTFAVRSVQLALGTWPLNEEIEVTIYLPNERSNHPVVIFHHGFLLSGSEYTSYAEHFASWGYAVIVPDVSTNIFGGPTHTQLKEILMALIDWIESYNDDAAHPLSDAIDPERIAVAGHSLGGKIAFLTATEDTRIKAIMGIDPVDAQGGPFPRPESDFPSVTPELMDLIMVPSIVLGETTNATCEGAFCQACAPEADNFQQYFVHAVAPTIEIEMVNANHMSFLDNPNCGTACDLCPSGADDPTVTRRLSHGYLTAFLNVVLKSDMQSATYLDGSRIPLGLDPALVNIRARNGF